jgi:hypothetical protein
MSSQTPQSFNGSEEVGDVTSTGWRDDESVYDESAFSVSTSQAPTGEDYVLVGPPEYGTTTSAAGYGAAGPPEYGTTTSADGP